MTAIEAKKAVSSLTAFVANAKAIKASVDGTIWKITLPFLDHKGQDFRVYIYRRPRSKKTILTDGGSTVHSIRGLGTPQLKSLQDLLITYGLTLMEDMTVMERSDRPMSMRMMAYLQAWCAIDGMFRIWNTTKKEISNVVRPTE